MQNSATQSANRLYEETFYLIKASAQIADAKGESATVRIERPDGRWISFDQEGPDAYKVCAGIYEVVAGMVPCYNLSGAALYATDFFTKGIHTANANHAAWSKVLGK